MTQKSTQKKKTKKSRRGRGEGAVFYSDSLGCWFARGRPDGAEKDITRKGKTKGIAMERLRKALAEHRPGLPSETKALTVGAYLDHWCQNVSKPSVELSSWVSYERCVRLHLKPRIGGVKMTDLRPVHIEELFARMDREGVSGGNAKKVSEVLSTALEHAVRVELIRSNPAMCVPKPKASKEEIVIFTPRELKAIFAATKEHRFHGLILLAAATGARQGELLALSWDALDLDSEKPMMHVRRTLSQARGQFAIKEPKSERGRRKVSLPPFTVAALVAQRAIAEADGLLKTPVFCTKTGSYISQANFCKRDWAPILELAEVPYRKFHTLRHTHASELLTAGVPVLEVARRLGDTPEVILKTYGQYIPGTDDGIAGKLESLYGEG